MSCRFIIEDDDANRFDIRYFNIVLVLTIYSIMIGKCDECGMENVEVKSIKKPNSNKEITLCNQCRPADGAYAY